MVHRIASLALALHWRQRQPSVLLPAAWCLPRSPLEAGTALLLIPTSSAPPVLHSQGSCIPPAIVLLLAIHMLHSEGWQLSAYLMPIVIMEGVRAPMMMPCMAEELALGLHIPVDKDETLIINIGMYLTPGDTGGCSDLSWL